jgi:hypothetical protein
VALIDSSGNGRKRTFWRPLDPDNWVVKLLHPA